MKLDTDLVRKILLHIEANEEGEISLVLPDYSQDEVYLHVALMQEAGFVDADVVPSGDGTEHEILYCEVHNLTWEGHAFLKNARNPKLLERAKNYAWNRRESSRSICSRIFLFNSQSADWKWRRKSGQGADIPA